MSEKSIEYYHHKNEEPKRHKHLQTSRYERSPERKEDFGAEQSEEIGRQIFSELLGVDNVEKATNYEDGKHGMIPKTPDGWKQPKVDFWIRSPENPSAIIGIQWTFSENPEKKLEKVKNVLLNNGLAWRERGIDHKIKTNGCHHVYYLQLFDHTSMEEIWKNFYQPWKNEDEAKRGLFLDTLDKSIREEIVKKISHQLEVQMQEKDEDQTERAAFSKLLAK